MMAASGANVVYARPIRLVKDKDRPQLYPKRSTEDPKKTKHVTIAAPKINRVVDIENSSPPPRPPPPRPARVPKHPSTDNHRPVSQLLPRSSHHNQTTPEPKPLTRTNVTSHDKLWKNMDDEECVPGDVLSPPLKHITPETAEEMWRNFDPLDVIDSTSDHSDSSADTMIMMTTEEEKVNQERIDSSIREYQSRKSKPDIPNTNKLKVNIQSKKNLHIHFSDTNGLINMPVPLTNGVSYPASETVDSVSKVTPLHVRTNNDSNGSSPESLNSKQNGQYSSPNDSPDDGYGTNSSTGTVASPFSSSFNSDLDNSCNGSMKKLFLPNGAIKPNSVRESWAVKRKQRMIDAQDNSVQDQLRELAIIEEESSGNVAHERTGTQQQVNRYSVKIAGYGKNSVENEPDSESLPVPPRRPLRTNLQSNSHVVNVSQTDLSRQNGELFVRNNLDPDEAPQNVGPHLRSKLFDSGETNSLGAGRSDSARAPSHYSSANEINAPRRVPPTYNDVMGNRRSQRGRKERQENSGDNARNGERLPERSRDTRLSSNDRESSDFTSLPNSVSGAPLLRAGDSLPDSVSSAPLLRGGDSLLRGGDSTVRGGDSTVRGGDSTVRGGDRTHPHPTHLGSGKIYVSPSGDEGFYSLNRSSRSTSISSFDPLLEQPDNRMEQPGNRIEQRDSRMEQLDIRIEEPGNTAEAPSSPRSPLELLSGDLLEKWTDMDRNYRNYYGFGAENEKYSRTDSKINYFQEKKINNLYGHDNYYQPSNFGDVSHVATQGQGHVQSQGHVQGQGHVSGRSSGNQGTQRDLQTVGVSQTDSGSSGRTSSMRSHKTSKEGEKSKSKLFQILPNMFKPSSKKQNGEQSKKKPKSGILKPSTAGQPETQAFLDVPQLTVSEHEPESEYMNLGDVPYSTMAHILQEEKLARGEYVPLESLQRRPVFASSKDIQKLFSKQNQSFDSIHSPGSQRHSFHAMPLSYRHVISSTSEDDDMRPRAQSTSAAMRSQSKASVENRMAVIAQKNALVMAQAKQTPGNLAAGSVGNLSLHSNSSNHLRTASSRVRLNSGSSSGGGDSKLSTLV